MDFSDLEGFDWDMGNIGKIESRLDLATVEFAFQGRPYVAHDGRHSQKGDDRFLLVNRVGDRFVFAAFTLRNLKIRVVSARFMRRREIKRYENWFKEE